MISYHGKSPILPIFKITSPSLTVSLIKFYSKPYFISFNWICTTFKKRKRTPIIKEKYNNTLPSLSFNFKATSAVLVRLLNSKIICLLEIVKAICWLLTLQKSLYTVKNNYLQDKESITSQKLLYLMAKLTLQFQL